MKATKCAICKTSGNFDVLFKQNFTKKDLESKIFSARRLPDRKHYRLVKCRKCGLVRSNPILSFKEIAKLYKKSDVTYQSEIPFLKKTYGKYLQKAASFLTFKKSVLDIGCGDGFFLEEAKEQKFAKVFGVEPGESAVKKARKDIRKNIKIGLFSKDLFKNQKFQIVTCFHTLDHVLDPEKVLKDIRSILEKDGLALIIVHNTQAFPAKIIKESCPIYDVEHIYLFDKKTLKTIFENAGFGVIDVFDIWNTYPLSYWLRLFPLPNFLKISLLSFGNKTGLLKIPMSIPPGNIGIIARK